VMYSRNMPCWAANQAEHSLIASGTATNAHSFYDCSIRALFVLGFSQQQSVA